MIFTVKAEFLEDTIFRKMLLDASVFPEENSRNFHPQDRSYSLHFALFLDSIFEVYFLIDECPLGA